jgi:hypothetical protein
MSFILVTLCAVVLIIGCTGMSPQLELEKSEIQYSKPITSTHLIKGEIIKYDLWFDHDKWTVIDNENPIFMALETFLENGNIQTKPTHLLTHKYDDDTMALIFEEHGSMTNMEVFRYFSKLVGSDKNIQIISKEIRMVNGKDMLYMKFKSNKDSTITTALSYSFSNKTGSIGIVVIRSDFLNAELESEIIDLFNGLVVPGSELAVPKTTSETVSPKTTFDSQLAGEVKAPTLYTAYNIWKASKMKCINFKQGTDIIPAGTEVKDISLWNQRRDSNLDFTTVKNARKYTIGFTKRWHPKKSMEDYRNMMFTTKNFEALTEGLSAMEIEAIKKGVLINGMSKRAVLICYGPPPEHYTPDQNANTWYYWANRKDKFEIKFDHQGKLVIGERSSQVNIKTERQSETMASKSHSSSASETQVAAIPKIKVNKKEPWTGIWQVEGHRDILGQWAMKQKDKSVVSTSDSAYKLEGIAQGNQLKGRIVGDNNMSNRFELFISSDGQSFEGKLTRYGDTSRIKGKRIE